MVLTGKVARRCQGTIGTDRTAQSGRQRLSALKASRAPVGEEDLLLNATAKESCKMNLWTGPKFVDAVRS